MLPTSIRSITFAVGYYEMFWWTWVVGFLFMVSAFVLIYGVYMPMIGLTFPQYVKHMQGVMKKRFARG